MLNYEMPIHRASEEYRAMAGELAIALMPLSCKEAVWQCFTLFLTKQFGLDATVIYELPAHSNTLKKVTFETNSKLLGWAIALPKDVVLAESTELCAQKKIAQLAAESALEKSASSQFVIPISKNGAVSWLLVCSQSHLNYFNANIVEELRYYCGLVHHKVAELNESKTLENKIQQLEYDSNVQDVLFDIAELIFETETIYEFYKSLHACIGRLTVAKNFYVAQLVDDGTKIMFRYYQDEYDTLPIDDTVPLDPSLPSISGYVLLKNEPLLVYEQEMARMMDEGKIFIRGELPKAWLGVPFGDEKNRGLVVVQSYSSSFLFNEKDKQLLTFVGKHIYNAIERKRAKSELQFLALHDSLTKLPNRVLFKERVEHALASCKRNADATMAVFFLDLDKFKQVNDNFGHHMGDKLLQEVTERIRTRIRATDTLCRLGGDEFAVLFEDVKSQRSVEKIAKSIIEIVRQAFVFEGIELKTSTSIGVVYHEQGNLTVERLLIQADEAMYQAKLYGRDQYVVYDKNLKSKARSTVAKLEHDFVEAIESKEFFLEFQPLINLGTGKIASAEALVRWRHGEHGVIPPNLFLPELIKTGQIKLLDRYVLEHALAQLQRWADWLPKGFKLNVNMSTAGFTSHHFIEQIQAIHQKNANLLKHLCVEITEQSIVDDVVKTRKTMMVLRKLGISVALDDFGTGYSSLSYLHQFKFDNLKIDRSFVKNIARKQDKNIILKTIINLARSLQISTTVEGIEELSQALQLREMECNLAQGYYFSKPVDVEVLTAMMVEDPSFL